MHHNKFSSLCVCFVLGPGTGGTVLGPGTGGAVPGSGPTLPVGGKAYNLSNQKLTGHYPVLNTQKKNCGFQYEYLNCKLQRQATIAKSVL